MPIFDHFDFLAPLYETFIPPKDPQEMWVMADLPVSGALLNAGGGMGDGPATQSGADDFRAIHEAGLIP